MDNAMRLTDDVRTAAVRWEKAWLRMGASPVRCTAGSSTSRRARPSAGTAKKRPPAFQSTSLTAKSRCKYNVFKIMKSSYELAMERLNKTAPVVKLTDRQK